MVKHAACFSTRRMKTYRHSLREIVNATKMHSRVVSRQVKMSQKPSAHTHTADIHYRRPDCYREGFTDTMTTVGNSDVHHAKQSRLGVSLGPLFARCYAVCRQRQSCIGPIQLTGGTDVP